MGVGFVGGWYSTPHTRDCCAALGDQQQAHGPCLRPASCWRELTSHVQAEIQRFCEVVTELEADKQAAGDMQVEL